MGEFSKIFHESDVRGVLKPLRKLSSGGFRGVEKM